MRSICLASVSLPKSISAQAPTDFNIVESEKPKQTVDPDLLFAQRRRLAVFKRNLIDFKNDPQAIRELVKYMEHIIDYALNDM